MLFNEKFFSEKSLDKRIISEKSVAERFFSGKVTRGKGQQPCVEHVCVSATINNTAVILIHIYTGSPSTFLMVNDFSS